MNKKLLTLAVAAAMVAPAAVMADATMYGKVRLAVESYDDGGTDYARIQNYSSRIGVKGSEDLGGGLKAVYKMEFGVNIADTTDEFSGGNSISNRNAYVGLAGDWGTMVLGRHDTPLKMSTGKLDYFGDQAGDNGLSYTEAQTDRRANGTLAYITPNMGGLTIAAAVVPGENSQADGLADAYSVAAMYSNSGIYASVAYEAGDTDIDALAGSADTNGCADVNGTTQCQTVNTGIGDLAQMRVGLGYDGGNWRIGATWENVDIELDDQVIQGLAVTTADIDSDHYMLNAGFDFGNNTVKAKYFEVEDSHDGFAVGLDHNFSKRTQGYLVYANSDPDSGGDSTEV